LNEVIDFCFANKEKIDEEMERNDKKKIAGDKTDKTDKTDKAEIKKETNTVKIIVQF
jgi:hypothetical protein